MKKSSIDANRYLDYLWELCELPSYIIGGVGGLQRLTHLGLSIVQGIERIPFYTLHIVRIRGSSHPCGNIQYVGK